ncbi:MAG: HD domain-containing protein [Phycisphaerales bacterium]|nr:MAG: HD domain-containing protein [Phycisphaerales bacterium]
MATPSASSSVIKRQAVEVHPVDDIDRLMGVCRRIGEGLPIEEILSEILTEARRLTNAEGGTVFAVESHRLRFVCCQNDARPDVVYKAAPGEGHCPIRGALGSNSLPLDSTSLSGYAATTLQTLRIDDVYDLPVGAPYRYNSAVDKSIGYRCVSMIVTPLLDARGEVVGVLQLLNKRDAAGNITTFTAREQRIVEGVACIASTSVREAQIREQQQRSHLDTILRLATAAEYRDGETGDHLRRVGLYCETIARACGRPRDWARMLLLASPMHDIGKLGVADAVLLKPGKFTPEERAAMERHTTIGASILAEPKDDLMRMAERIARTHHERWDGKGYPAGLAGDDIPLEGRIVAVADVFDALTSKRVYKAAFPRDDAFKAIEDGAGAHFDPDVAKGFLGARSEIESIYEAFSPDAPG